MSKTIASHAIWFLILLIWVAVPICAHAQRKIDPHEEKIRFNGISFSLLPFSESVKKVTSGKSFRIEGIKIETKTHDLRRPSLVTTELCSTIIEGRPEIAVEDDDFLYRVKYYVSYEVTGKVFAFEVNYEFFDKKTGDEVGATTGAFYVDETGNGTFGIKCVKDFKLATLPGWVKKLASK